MSIIKQNILVVDDEPDIRSLVQEILEDEGFNVNVAENAKTARELFNSFQPDLVLLDIWMPDIDGISLLKEWKETDNVSTPIIMMSGHGNVETAVESTKHGAYDFIEKPLSIAKLLLTIKHALETIQLKQENLQLHNTSLQNLEPIGKSKQITELKKQIIKIASHDAPVLIFGESGTDKEQFARFIHSLSEKSEGPFISISTSSIGAENADSVIFGSQINDNIQPGLIDKAQGGTLFLKDIGELDLKLQSRLYDVLQNKSYMRNGSSNRIELDTRVIAATRYNIEQLISEGKFRDELYYQLNVLPLNIPALKEHFEDIPALLEFYVNHFIETEGFPYRRFDVASQNRLRSYQWPGNVRELKNLVQRLLILANDEIISLSEVETALGNISKHDMVDTQSEFDFDLPLREARENFERSYLEYQLKKNNGSVSKVANNIGIERTHLYRKLKTLGIDLK